MALGRVAQRCRGRALGLFPSLDSHLPAAAVMLPLINTHRGGAGILLEVRAAGMRLHAGEIALPGGRLEPAEESWQAARREAEEEIGWPGGVLVDSLGEWHNRKSNMRVTPWLVIREPPLDLERELRICPSEVDHVFVADLSQLLNPQRKEYRHIRAGWPPVPFFRPDDQHVIWGFTGFVLDAFLAELAPALGSR